MKITTTIISCDRCGEEIPIESNYGQVSHIFADSSAYYVKFDRDYDLCPACSKELEKFLKNKKK